MASQLRYFCGGSKNRCSHLLVERRTEYLYPSKSGAFGDLAERAIGVKKQVTRRLEAAPVGSENGVPERIQVGCNSH
jgi:hypothetical protein